MTPNDDALKGWQPISTVPRIAKEVLVWSRVFGVAVVSPRHMGPHYNGSVTHWMPLPEPPQPEEQP